MKQAPAQECDSQLQRSDLEERLEARCCYLHHKRAMLAGLRGVIPEEACDGARTLVQYGPFIAKDAIVVHICKQSGLQTS